MSIALAWSKDRQLLALFMHSLHEPGELLQCSKRDDSTINIIVVIIITLLGKHPNSHVHDSISYECKNRVATLLENLEKSGN